MTPQQPFAPYYYRDEAPETWARLRWQNRAFLTHTWNHPTKTIDELLNMVHAGANMDREWGSEVPMVDHEFDHNLNREFAQRWYLKDAGYPMNLDAMILKHLTWMNRPSSELSSSPTNWW